MADILTIAGRDFRLFGDPGAAFLCFQPMDEHDLSAMAEEMQAVEEALGRAAVCVAALPIRDWNTELSPWTAPPVYGQEPFGDGAGETLARLTDQTVPALEKRLPPRADRQYLLAGYSLAGLFALWSAYRTDAFAGVVAASPSVWYPGWDEFARARRPLARAVYLSLGDREERTRHPVMREVGNAIRRQRELLAGQGVQGTLEWNPGNHFMDAPRRTARAFAWAAWGKEMDPAPSI